MDSVRSGPFGQIFRPDNFIFGQVRSTLGAHCSSAADFQSVEVIGSDVECHLEHSTVSKVSSPYRLERETIGRRGTTPRVPSSSTLFWMLCGRRPRAVIAYKVKSCS